MELFGQVVGAAIMTFTLADVFLTILYARVGRGRVKRLGAGFISLVITQVAWAAFRRLPTKAGVKQEVLSSRDPWFRKFRQRDRALSRGRLQPTI
ncbi:MAG TPA: hypothetical protein VF573_15830 [Paraburkholderia sp.]|uniref:hypothetical protein n=1 Tax=Paraburkholderia sp. TaxID=1926495 RepID=UPI002ED3B648